MPNHLVVKAFVTDAHRDDHGDVFAIAEYLGRLPPVERWQALAKETRDWDWRDA